MAVSLLLSTEDIKYTMTKCEFETDFLKRIGAYHALNPTQIAGVISGGKYRLPPIQVVKEDGKKSWKATPVDDAIFTGILTKSGREGQWVVTRGEPCLSEVYMSLITGIKLWDIEGFEIYKTPLGHVALVTHVDTETN